MVVGKKWHHYLNATALSRLEDAPVVQGKTLYDVRR